MTATSRRLCLLGLVALSFPGVGVGAAVALPSQEAQGGGDAVAELVAKLKSQADTADPTLVQSLAAVRTRAALEGLLEAYSSMSTVWMQREIVRVLHLFDGVPEAEMLALQRLMDVATQASEPELRSAALDGLGESKSKGKDFLEMIVKSPAESEVRVHAMRLHVALANEDDHAWYHELYKPVVEEPADKDKKEKKREPKGKKKAEDEPKEPKKPRILDDVRRMAFEVIRSGLTPDELVEAALDRNHEIRSIALLEIEGRGDPRALELAQAALARPTPTDGGPINPTTEERADVRLTAARIVARLGGPKVAEDFIKRGTSVDTPVELSRGIAEILVGFGDADVNRDLIGRIGKGREKEKLFILYAVRGIQDPKVDRAVEKMLTDREQEVVIAACKIVAERKDAQAAGQLHLLIGKTGKQKPLARAALDALAVVRSGDPKWVDELVGMVKSDDSEVRNMALQALGQTTDKKFLDKLVEALQNEDWSTRLAAMDALERMHDKEAIPPLIARLSKEDGRMKEELSGALRRLTGQLFEDNAAAWENWWKQGGEAFQFPTTEQVAKIKAGEDEWRLKQATRVETKFFGIRIVSRKAILVLDISNSMEETLASDYEGKSNPTRIEVAKAEMDKCLKGLDPGAFFNVIVFCADAARWVEGGLAAATEKNREDARAFVDTALMCGATNTYGALKEAFADPDVDTIYFVTDGEPTAGDETDPVVIREHVAQWNEHRGIVIHTIAVGGQFDLLEWLAEDSGGTHLKYE